MVQRCGIVLVTLCSVNRYFNLSGLVFTRIVTETPVHTRLGLGFRLGFGV